MQIQYFRCKSHILFTKGKFLQIVSMQAMFGDVHTHHAETLPQAEAFVHRFGPGLIIYWYGHAPIERLSDGYGDISVLAWNAPSCIMLPTGEFCFHGAKYPSFTSK